MANTYWYKQTKAQPLFPDLEWSRPETKHTAGKLLIIGGNVHSFAAAASAFTTATKAGIGTIRILLPDVLQKTVSKLIPEAEFAASTPSGSFSNLALDTFLEHASWADGVLLAGDLGRNSETAVLLEKFVNKSDCLLTLTKDSVDYFIRGPEPLLHRANTTVVLSLAQLQILASQAHFKTAFSFSMDLLRLMEALHDFTTTYSLNIIVKHLDNIFVATQGQVSTTKTGLDAEDSWRLPAAASAAVWWLQNQTKVFEALSSSVV